MIFGENSSDLIFVSESEANLVSESPKTSSLIAYFRLPLNQATDNDMLTNRSYSYQCKTNHKQTSTFIKTKNSKFYSLIYLVGYSVCRSIDYRTICSSCSIMSKLIFGPHYSEKKTNLLIWIGHVLQSHVNCVERPKVRHQNRVNICQSFSSILRYILYHCRPVRKLQQLEQLTHFSGSRHYLRNQL